MGESRDKLIREPGRAMNPKFLGKLNDAYDEIVTQYGAEFEPLHIVNTSADQNTSPRNTAFGVAEKMIEHFKKGEG